MTHATDDVLERCRLRAYELHIAFRTGYECSYCGNPRTTQNRYGLFCAGCGIERLPILGTACGIPVYDAADYAALCVVAQKMGAYSFGLPALNALAGAMKGG